MEEKYNKLQIEQFARKAKIYDELIDEIDKFYETHDEAENVIPPEKIGDLADIGEVILYKLNYL